jgi:hypothetical protein
MPLKLEIKRTVAQMTVHWVGDSEIWASSGYSFYTSRDEGVTFEKTGDLTTSSLNKILGKSRLITRGMRWGIRDLRRLNSGTVLVIADRKVYRSSGNGSGAFKSVYKFRKGVGPLREGWCEDDEGNCYLAEYFLNNGRDSSVNLVKSTDDGHTWETIASFDRIRHIHCVQFDPFSRCIWLGTGDRDDESSIRFSEDRGDTWSAIGSRDQMFRTVSFIFTKDYVYWGSDAPTKQNYVYRQTRKNGAIDKLAAVNSPVHYSTMLENGTIVFGTTAEGNSEGKSAAWDDKAHIWASPDGKEWTDVASWEKDVYPYILGLGRIYFPHGRSGDNIYFTTEALRNVDNTLFCAKLKTHN